MSFEKVLSSAASDRETLVTVGVFDGVHLGHISLIKELARRASDKKFVSTVVTFWPNPQGIISPAIKVPFLTNPHQRAALLKECGVELVVTLPFTQRLASLKAEGFISLLIENLRMRGLVVGPDFALGKSRQGNIELLKQLGYKHGFDLVVMPPLEINGTAISSSAIRKALFKGDMETVKQMTGRDFSLCGKVVKGDGRGVSLGFATANLDLDPSQAIPADGVYIARSYPENEPCDSLVNIGIRPTFGGTRRIVEVHILGFNKNLYGQELKTDIIKRLRGEVHFSRVEDLKQQVADDIKKAEIMFKTSG